MTRKLNAIKRLNKWWEDYGYRRNILESILVSSTTNEQMRFPTIKQFILSEVVNGTIAYTGGNAGQFYYRKPKSSEDGFEYGIWNYLKSETKKSKVKLSPTIGEAINKLCEMRIVPAEGPMGRSYADTELYNQFKDEWGSICEVDRYSSFSLPQETVVCVQKKFLPKLSIPEITDIMGIGKAMRPFIEKDLEFVKKQYHW
jgi:hypothetical protein